MKSSDIMLLEMFNVKNLAQIFFVHYKQLSKITTITLLGKLAVSLKFFMDLVTNPGN